MRMICQVVSAKHFVRNSRHYLYFWLSIQVGAYVRDQDFEKLQGARCGDFLICEVTFSTCRRDPWKVYALDYADMDNVQQYC